jgi:hypothetical protein
MEVKMTKPVILQGEVPQAVMDCLELLFSSDTEFTEIPPAWEKLHWAVFNFTDLDKYQPVPPMDKSVREMLQRAQKACNFLDEDTKVVCVDFGTQSYAILYAETTHSGNFPFFLTYFGEPDFTYALNKRGNWVLWYPKPNLDEDEIKIELASEFD